MALLGNREHQDINPWLIAIAVMSSTFMEVLDTTVVNVSLPHIAGSLSATNDEATWTLTSYLVANAIILPMTGWLAGRFGRKRLLMLSVTGFTAASFLCGLAPSLPFLILCRVIQGACGGGLQPLSQAILLESFPPEKRGQAMAFWALGIVVAPMLGPVSGSPWSRPCSSATSKSTSIPWAHMCIRKVQQLSRCSKA
jgi:MFS transporter, DHA2 family, multidrug resistance protein